MKKTIFLLIGLLFMFLGFLAEVKQDILPLGNSRYKFMIAKIEKGQLIETESNQRITIRELIKKNPNTNVFMIGESHDSYRCHQFQRDFIEALFQIHPQIIVGFEFFNRQDNEILEQWRRGQIEERLLLEKTGWYKKTGFNYGYTRLIMDVIKKHQIKTIGLNVPRTILRKVSRKGFDSLTTEEKQLFPTIGEFNPEHQFFIKSIFGSFALQAPQWFDRIYSAQICWDVIMAESMNIELKKKENTNHKGIIIAGSNHIAYNLGIPFRYKLSSPNDILTSIVPVSVPKTDKQKDEQDPHPMMMMVKNKAQVALFSRGIADYVLAIAEQEAEYFPNLGITGNFSQGGIVVSRIAKKSLAELKGIKKGDKIIKIDGIKIESQQQFRFLLAQKQWDDSLQLTCLKNIKLEKNK